MRSSPRQIRQGDVLLVARPAPTDPPVPVHDDQGQPLAGLRVPGERTGHAHVLPATVFESAGRRLLYLDAPTVLSHEEHAPVTVPAGWWEPRLQRQYAPRGNVRRARFD